MGVSPESVSDADVVVASWEDPERFGEIFSRYHDTIFRYVARRLGPNSAADVTAEVFVRAFRIRFRYDATRVSCRPWLYGIATNVIGDQLRSRSRSQRNTLSVAIVAAGSDDDTARSDERIDAAALGPILNEALARLRPGDRDVLLLYAVEELSYGEVAEALTIPIGTVRSRLHRARRQLRELIPSSTQMTGQSNDHQRDNDNGP
jgi:RNA polymerase sigma-70 factor, ECF subfamily